MPDNASQVDLSFGAMQATLANICRLSAALGEARREILKIHVKALEEQLKTCKATLNKVSGARDWQTLQESFARAASDNAEHQAALAREYAKLMADGMSAWLEECRACGDQWLSVDPQSQRSPATANGSLADLSTMFTDFYGRLGRMTFMPDGQGGDGSRAAGPQRARQAS